MCAIVHLLLIQKMNRFEKIGHGKTIGKREGKERGGGEGGGGEREKKGSEEGCASSTETTFFSLRILLFTLHSASAKLEQHQCQF